MVSKVRMGAVLMSLLLLNGCSDSSSEFEVPGVLAWDRVELTNESREPILSLDKQEGEKVQAGDVLLTLDCERAQTSLEKAEAVENQLTAKFEELTEGYRQEDIEQAKQNVVQAKSKLDLSQLEVKRVEQLYRKKLVSLESYDKAKSAVVVNQSLLTSARANLLKLNSGNRIEQIDQARNQLTAAQNDVKLVQIALERMKIVAPRDGVLDSLPFLAGEEPPMGSVVAVMLVGKQPYTRVHVPEQIRAWIKPGGVATVKVDGVNQQFDARVRSISQTPDFTPYYSLTQQDRSRLSYVAKVDLLNAESAQLAAGVAVTVIFQPPKTLSVAPK